MLFGMFLFAKLSSRPIRSNSVLLYSFHLNFLLSLWLCSLKYYNCQDLPWHKSCSDVSFQLKKGWVSLTLTISNAFRKVHYCPWEIAFRLWNDSKTEWSNIITHAPYKVLLHVFVWTLLGNYKFPYALFRNANQKAFISLEIFNGKFTSLNTQSITFCPLYA